MNLADPQETLIKKIKMKNYKGSSETICETSLDFSQYLIYKPQHIKALSYSDLSWIIGFFEGDGSFCMNRNDLLNPAQIAQGRPKAEIGNLSIHLYQHSRDIALLYKIRTILGYGKVNTMKNRPISYININTQENIHRFLMLLNGNLCCPHRIRQIQDFIKLYNIKYKPKTEVIYNNRVNIPSFYNAWLSGFIDAEGCFMLSLRENERIEFKFKLNQKENHILLNIHKLFNLKESAHLYHRNTEKHNEWEFYCGNKNFRTNLIKYLNEYPLRSKKKIPFLKWKNAHGLVNLDRHKSEEGKKAMLRLALRLNYWKEIWDEDRVRSLL